MAVRRISRDSIEKTALTKQGCSLIVERVKNLLSYEKKP